MELIDLDELNVDEPKIIRIKGLSLTVPPLTLSVYLRAVALDAEADIAKRMQRQHELVREVIDKINPGKADEQFWAGLSLTVMKRLFYAVLERWDQLRPKKEAAPGSREQASLPDQLISEPSSSSSPSGSDGPPIKSEP